VLLSHDYLLRRLASISLDRRDGTLGGHCFVTMEAVAAQQAVLQATYLFPILPAWESGAALALCCMVTMCVGAALQRCDAFSLTSVASSWSHLPA